MTIDPNICIQMNQRELTKLFTFSLLGSKKNNSALQGWIKLSYMITDGLTHPRRVDYIKGALYRIDQVGCDIMAV